MRRVARWLWNSATLLSLLMLAAVVVLWVRSDLYVDGWYWDGGHGAYDLRAVRSGHGEIQYAHERTGYPSMLVPFRHGFASLARTRGAFGRWIPNLAKASGWGPVHVARVSTYWFSVTVEDWVLAVLFGVLPALWAAGLSRKLYRRSRLSASQCPSCGYDLRATPDRCPECGRATSPAAVRLGWRWPKASPPLAVVPVAGGRGRS
jgi:hypothetical protein